MKKRITQDDYIKANRKASREAEIEMYGHPICHKRVHQSKKVYNRKKIKATDKELPSFLSFSHNPRQFSGCRINNESVYLHIHRNQRMMHNKINRSSYRLLCIFEAVQP